MEIQRCRQAIQWICTLVILVPSVLCSANALANDMRPANAEAVTPLLIELTEVSLSKAPPVLDALAFHGGVEMLELFNVMLEGDLYYRKSDLALFNLVKNSSGEYSAKAFFVEGAVEQAAEKKSFRKIRVNNRLRVKLRGLMASIQLNAEQPEERKQAVQVMMGKMDDAIRSLFLTRLDLEQHEGVKKELQLAIAFFDAKHAPEQALRLEAIQVLNGSLNSDVRNMLRGLTEVDPDGLPLEPSLPVREAAAAALDGIQGKIRFFGLMEQLFFGLSLGSVLLLAAIGLSITFGVMGVINMAHGEMIMLGAYTAYVMQLLLPDQIGLSIVLAIPAAFCVSGLVGILIERGVIQFLKGRPLETLLATFGISLILQELVRFVFSPLNRQVIAPDWLSGSLMINEVFSVTYNRLYILIFALIIFAALQLLLKRSRLGLNVRAVSQNREMAKAMGIHTERVDMMTFGLGSGIAGVAGVALSQLTNVGPNLGQSYIIDSFMVVVFGGVGNLLGTLVGGFTLGIATKFLEPATGAVLANIIILVFIILFIQRRPQGIFPQVGRAAND